MLEIRSATVIDGHIRLDEPLELPNDSRIQVSVHPLTSAFDPIDAWNSIKERLRLRPIKTDGKKFTRDELYERD